MAPKRKERESLESLLARPWCYYCDRDFDDLKILHDHQKAKHFHCIVGTCNRRLNTAGGLYVHMEQVHKEKLERVPNALPERQSLTPEVFGMEGVPQSMLDHRTSLVIKEYNKMESEWRARTGNPLSGTKAAKEEAEQARKRQRVAVDKEELKRRAAAAKAARAAKQAGVATPDANQPPRPAGTEDDFEQPEPVLRTALNSQPSFTPPAVASPYTAPPPAMPMSSTPALPTPTAAPVPASPYQMPPSISPPGFSMGMYQPPGMPMPMNAPAYSPQPMPGYGAPPPGLPARVNMPLPGMNGLPSIPGLPPRPSPVPANGATKPADSLYNAAPPAQHSVPATTGISQSDVDAFINAEYEKSKSVPVPQKKGPTVESGAKLIYSDNFLTPEEKKSASPRYRRAPRNSTTQTYGQTQAASGPVDAY